MVRGGLIGERNLGLNLWSWMPSLIIGLLVFPWAGVSAGAVLVLLLA